MRVSHKLLGFFTFHDHKQPLVIYCHLFLVAISYNRLKLEYSENIDNFLPGKLDNLRSWVVFLCVRPSVSGFKFTVSHVFKHAGIARQIKAWQEALNIPNGVICDAIIDVVPVNIMVDTPPENQHKGVSKNNGTPKSSTLIGFSIINHAFWKHP